MLSFWEKTTFLDTQDVIIIGSGIVGLSTAIHIKRQAPNYRITVLERGTLPSGASTKNAGFACFGSISELLNDLEDRSEDEVFALVEKRWRGLAKLRELLGDTHIDFALHGGYEVFRRDIDDFEICRDAIPYFNNKIGGIIGVKKPYCIGDSHIAQLGFAGVQHLILNSAEGQLNPGKMMRRLITLAQYEGIQILNGIEVIALESDNQGTHLQSRDGAVLHAHKVLVATNGFARQLIKNENILPARNQVMITEPILNLKINGCFHMDRGYFYFRNVGHRLLFGGGRHLDIDNEQTDAFGTTSIIQEALLDLARSTILPGIDFEVDHWWSGIMGIGEKKEPIVQQYDDNVYLAVRLGGMGVALGCGVGEEAAELMIRRDKMV